MKGLWPRRGRIAGSLALAMSAWLAVFGPGSADATEVQSRAAFRRPDSIPFPQDNAYTDAKAGLGQMLFFDPRLSGPGTMSCASCHNPALTWRDALPRGVGHDAKTLGRSTPTVLNLAWADLLMWDGRKDGLEDQASGPITSTAEMNLQMPDLVGRLASLDGYRRAFRDAYGSEEVSPARIVQAIATFERTLVSNKAPFDRWVEGDEKAINDEAKRGFGLFAGRANCAACHSGWRFTDDGFHDIGLASNDPGRAAIIDEPSLEHAFKTPTLRNVVGRGPYMHDGSVPTLEEVVRHYDTGFVQRATLSPEMRRLALTPQDVQDLVAFMRTLTSVDDPITIPTLPGQEH